MSVMTSGFAGLDPNRQSVFDAVYAIFSQYGMQDLANIVFDGITQYGPNAGLVAEHVRASKPYKDRFPQMDEIRKKQPGFTEGNYFDYERHASGLERQYGLPAGFLSNTGTVSNMLVNGVSADELSSRVAMNDEAARSALPEIRDSLKRMYGLSDGDITAYYLDPDNGYDVLSRRAAAARLAGAGQREGFMVGVEQAERLAGLGFDTWEQSQQRFQQAAENRNLTSGLGERVTQEQVIGSAFGASQAEQAEVRRIGQARGAQFQGGGGYVGSQQGMGIGSAAT